MPEPSREFLLQLVSESRIKGSQLDELTRSALDASYWRRLVPDFHVGGDASPIECAPLVASDVEAAIRTQAYDGYFRLNGVIAPEGVRRLNAAINAVVDAGWPPSFVFMYDEAWQSARSPALTRVIESVLGPGFHQICHVWAHVVKPVIGASGWSPHTDGHTDTSPAGRMSAWVGLTEATLDNGCMHVIPRRAVSSTPDLLARFQQRDGQFARPEVSQLLQSTHALVTSPGDALGWGFDVIHWGGVVRRVDHERRGFSFEYIAAGEEPDHKDGIVSSMETLPPFEDRLRSIATALIAYRRFEPIVDRFADVAKAIQTHLEQ
jgi:ectoine hydroxylase-related dioxygenase (phytanoyl-CoA dioxygenase family)